VKKSWRVIKDIINKDKPVLNTHFLIDNSSTSDLSLISNRFNSFFVNIGKNLSRTIPPVDTDPLVYLQNVNTRNSLFLRNTDNEEVSKIILDLKDSSSGYDEINSSVIKSSYHMYIDTLVHIINLCLSQGTFPNELKVARVVPLFKSGDARLVQNYRPISVLSVFSKIFERVIYIRLFEYLEKNEILSNSQFGFRKGHSTITALIVLIDKILAGFNKGDITLGIYLDFSKAFDTINHNILLRKLSKYGIRGIALDLLCNYLDSRSQYVSFNSFNSDLLPITCGVPQGSILGPLLFILYINDISTVSDILFSILYADDSNLFVQGKNISRMVSTMNAELVKIVTWINANQLSLNIGKTSYMIFKTKNKKILPSDDIKINNCSIDRVYDIKFLGVFLDCHLNWNKHVMHVRNKICKSIGILYKVRKLLHKHTLITLYYSFVYPYLNYAVELWGSSSKQNMNSLLIVQKKIVRILSNAPYKSHSAPLFSDLKILHVYKIYQYHVSLLMIKIYKKLCPNILINLFVNMSFNSYDTRQNVKYRLPLYNLIICQKGFKYQGALLWNYIVGNIDIRYSVITIKKHIKNTYLPMKY
jgi:hypothetical protein